jgi:hypothetical protein
MKDSKYCFEVRDYIAQNQFFCICMDIAACDLRSIIKKFRRNRNFLSFKQIWTSFFSILLGLNGLNYF